MNEFILGTKKVSNMSGGGGRRYNVNNQKDSNKEIDLNFDMTHIEKWDKNNFLAFKIQIKKIFGEKDGGSGKCLVMLASMDKFL
jgi:hypothetical protein